MKTCPRHLRPPLDDILEILSREVCMVYYNAAGESPYSGETLTTLPLF